MTPAPALDLTTSLRGDLFLDSLGVEFLRPALFDLEFLNMLTTFHRSALDSTLGRWLGPFGVHQVTVPHTPLGKDKGRGRTRGGGGYQCGLRASKRIGCV